MAFDLIKKFEGCSLTPYLCPAGKPTIGYGATSYQDGTKVTMKDDPITEERAELLLATYIELIERCINDVLRPQLKDNQIDALISFVYNVGFGAFQKSTLLRMININPDNPRIYDEFLRWNKANGKVVGGLVRRRVAEAKLYFARN